MFHVIIVHWSVSVRQLMLLTPINLHVAEIEGVHAVRSPATSVLVHFRPFAKRYLLLLRSLGLWL